MKTFIWFKPSRDDIAAGLSFTCAVLGIGSLAMGRNFGRAGILPASVALFAMFLVNAFATVALSKAMRLTPKHVQTFSDLGEFAGGTFGRYAVVFTQFGTCLLVPIAFLVLGGSTILPVIFRDVWDEGGNPNVYIPLMALILLPVVLIRTLKEAAWAALLGTAGAVFGDLFAILDSMMHSASYTSSEPKLLANSVVSVFGSMIMSFGGAVVIPAIQREHPRPENMPTIIVVVLFVVSMAYFLIGLQGYYQYGCIAPANLLLAMRSRTMEIAAMVLFLVHILLAFAVYLNPALYLFERNVFGFYQLPTTSKSIMSNNKSPYVLENSPEPKDRTTIERVSIGSYTAGGELDCIDAEEYNAPFSFQERIKSAVLRTTVVAVQVFFAMLLQGSFEDLADFVGASCMVLSGIIIPVLIYMKVFQNEIKVYERVWIILIIMITSMLGLYTSTLYMRHIIDRASDYAMFHSNPPVSAASGFVNDNDTRNFCQVRPIPRN